VDHAHEVKEIENVCTRQAERFPQLGAEVIEAAVRLAHSELNEGIRDYLPVLVEHNARHRLAAIAEREDLAPAGSAASQRDEDTV
jgi:hypothetical protein